MGKIALPRSLEAAGGAGLFCWMVLLQGVAELALWYRSAQKPFSFLVPEPWAGQSLQRLVLCAFWMVPEADGVIWSGCFVEMSCSDTSLPWCETGRERGRERFEVVLYVPALHRAPGQGLVGAEAALENSDVCITRKLALVCKSWALSPV